MKIWYPFTIQKNHSPLKIVRAEKEFLYDGNDVEYIDAVSSWWTCIYGHRHPKIIDAISRQMESIDHIMLAGFTHDPALQLTEKLDEFTDFRFAGIFFSDNGSTAVEVALKMAVQYFYNQKKYNKCKVIHFSGSYHGDTIGAMSVGGGSIFNRPFIPLMFDSKEHLAPECYQCPFGSLKEHCNLECLEALEDHLAKHSEEIAAIIIEPMIMGAGGMKFYKKEVLQLLRKLCDNYNILLIHDEVFTGFGRTGKKFAYEHADITPDIMAIAKGLTGGLYPLAATLVTEKVYAEFESEDSSQVFFHGHTMTGNPVGCAAAVSALDIYQNEKTEEKIEQLCLFMEKESLLVAEEFNDIVLSTRTMGAVSVIEIKSEIKGYLSSVSGRIQQTALENGVILRPLGNILYITPPYFISRNSLQKIYNVIRICLAEIREDKKKMG